VGRAATSAVGVGRTGTVVDVDVEEEVEAEADSCASREHAPVRASARVSRASNHQQRATGFMIRGGPIFYQDYIRFLFLLYWKSSEKTR
jgi:hypothetical protein